MRTPTLLALPLTLLFPFGAHAQPSDSQQIAAAEALYEQANAELDAKKYTSACLKLEKVTRLVPNALGAKLTLGACYEGLGKLASAWEQYTLVEAMAQQIQQSDRAQKAAAKAAVLRPRLATLRLEVPPDVAALAGITVTLDGVTVNQAQWDTSLPVDVGAHEFVATARGREAWKKHVEMKADGIVVSIMVKPLPPEIVATARAASTAAPAAASHHAPVSIPMLVGRSESTDKPAVSDTSAGAEALALLWRQRPVELTAIGLGSVSVGVGAVLGILALTKDRENDSRQGLGVAALTSMLAGGSALAWGAMLVATTRPAVQGSGHGGTGKGVQAQLELLPCGFGVRGTW